MGLAAPDFSVEALMKYSQTLKNEVVLGGSGKNAHISDKSEASIFRFEAVTGSFRRCMQRQRLKLQ